MLKFLSPQLFDLIPLFGSNQKLNAKKKFQAL